MVFDACGLSIWLLRPKRLRPTITDLARVFGLLFRFLLGGNSVLLADLCLNPLIGCNARSVAGINVICQAAATEVTDSECKSNEGREFVWLKVSSLHRVAHQVASTVKFCLHFVQVVLQPLLTFPVQKQEDEAIAGCPEEWSFLLPCTVWIVWFDLHYGPQQASTKSVFEVLRDQCSVVLVLFKVLVDRWEIGRKSLVEEQALEVSRMDNLPSSVLRDSE